jgi:hypothetical protein
MSSRVGIEKDPSPVANALTRFRARYKEAKGGLSS